MMRAHDIMDNWITGRVVIIIIASNSNERNFIRFGIEVAFQIEHTIHAIPCIDHGWFCCNKGTESGMLNKICLFIWLPISVESNLSIRKKTDKAIKVLLLRPISFWYFWSHRNTQFICTLTSAGYTFRMVVSQSATLSRCFIYILSFIFLFLWKWFYILGTVAILYALCSSVLLIVVLKLPYNTITFSTRIQLCVYFSGSDEPTEIQPNVTIITTQICLQTSVPFARYILNYWLSFSFYIFFT